MTERADRDTFEVCDIYLLPDDDIPPGVIVVSMPNTDAFVEVLTRQCEIEIRRPWVSARIQPLAANRKDPPELDELAIWPDVPTMRITRE